MLSEYRGFHCQHRSDDFPIIRDIIATHRPSIAIELGTDAGGFAALLADTVAAWGGHAWTFDRERKFSQLLLDTTPNLTFVQSDVLAEYDRTLTKLIDDHEPVLLYCDDGNKVREIAMYGALLNVGDLLATHDYNTEVPSAWVEPFLATLGFEPEGHARMEALRNQWYPEPMTRFWVRRRRMLAYVDLNCDPPQVHV